MAGRQDLLGIFGRWATLPGVPHLARTPRTPPRSSPVHRGPCPPPGPSPLRPASYRKALAPQTPTWAGPHSCAFSRSQAGADGFEDDAEKEVRLGPSVGLGAPWHCPLSL